MSGTGRPQGPEDLGWAPPAGADPAGHPGQAPPPGGYGEAPAGTYGQAPAGGSYLRLSGLSPWIAWLLLAVGATYAISALITVAAHGFGEYTTPTALDQLGGADVALSVIGFVLVALEIAVAVLFIIWFYRAYKNLTIVGTAAPRRSVGWTIGAWFVPFLDLVLPKLMLDEVWRGSDPEAPDAGSPSRVPLFHHLWWWIWVVAFLLSIVIGVESGISSFDTALEGDGGAVTTANAGLSAASGLLHTVAAALGALVVRRTSERQEERARRLGWIRA